MALKYININGIQFVIQSYSKDDFCYLVSPCEGYCIRIEWNPTVKKGYTFSSNDKMDERWQTFVSKIDASDVKTTLDDIFSKHCG